MNDAKHPDALWSAILEYPHDDEPRMRYAHWLDERDLPRGEFIRLQCQLQKLPLHDPLRLELETREHELLADHEREWLGELDSLVDWAVFHRGFPTEISTSVDLFLRHGEAMLRLAPIQMIHLDRARDRLSELAVCPALGRISFVDLSNNHLRDQGVRQLAASPLLRNLEGLNLSSTSVGDAGVLALIQSQHLGSLRELYLCDNRITRQGVHALAASPLVRQLEVLSLRFNDFQDPHTLRDDPALSLHI